jgi:hypothetical protein
VLEYFFCNLVNDSINVSNYRFVRCTLRPQVPVECPSPKPATYLKLCLVTSFIKVGLLSHINLKTLLLLSLSTKPKFEVKED